MHIPTHGDYITRKFSTTWHDTKMIIIPAHGDYTSNLFKTRHNTTMFMLTLGEYSSNLKSMTRHVNNARADSWGLYLETLLKTRHDAKMIVPTLGEYHLNFFRLSRHNTKLFGPTQGAIYIKGIDSRYTSISCQSHIQK